MRAFLFLAVFGLGPVAGVVWSLWFVINLDIVTSRYDHYEDAVADDLFKRGWLPHFIPASSRGIVTVNNLDLNTSDGEFHYNPADTAAFLAELRPWQGG